MARAGPQEAGFDQVAPNEPKDINSWLDGEHSYCHRAEATL
jgi:hypothetical protein